jgi:hypothetical protein
MCEIDYKTSMIATCLGDLDALLNELQRRNTKGQIVVPGLSDWDTLRCGSDLCHSLATADPSADVPVLNFFRKRGITLDRPMLSAITKACERPYHRDLSALVTNPMIFAWSEYLHELACAVRELKREEERVRPLDTLTPAERERYEQRLKELAPWAEAERKDAEDAERITAEDLGFMINE